MRLFEHELTKNRPSHLFHYTSQKGLLGMVQKGEIWATMSGYLNDSSEFKVARELAHQVVSGRIATATGSLQLALLKDMQAVIDNTGCNLGVFCLTEAEDDLSQWRAYGANGSGYSIGFDANQLAELALKSQYILVPCIYEAAKQFDVFSRLVEGALLENLEKTNVGQYGEDERITAGNFAFYINRYALVFKDSGFRAEREWRLISRPLSYRSVGFDFREGSTSLIPYQKVPISFDENDLPIFHVLVGPTARPDEARKAVKGMLINRSLKLKRVLVGNSVIPFRT